MNKIIRERVETFEYLNRLFEYNPLTGQLFWKIRWPGRVAGTIVKPFRGRPPFIKIVLEGVEFKAHRLCWTLHHGAKTEAGLVIDHKDGDPANNAIANLRLCSCKENSRNTVTGINNTTGYKGVSKQGSRYRAYICVDRKQIHLGRFDTAEDAFAAYMTAAKTHFGEFKSYG